MVQQKALIRSESLLSAPLPKIFLDFRWILIIKLSFLTDSHSAETGDCQGPVRHIGLFLFV
ncbi:MAG: hypothetical protein BWK80_17465 [Desulfobacteraceae bacterium IS3]|nr:MAG: hypothetical protein BWK80_17465 [Desulfobacteraceae bacterium IS3]